MDWQTRAGRLPVRAGYRIRIVRRWRVRLVSRLSRPSDTGGSSLTPFVVRSDASHSDILFQTVACHGHGTTMRGFLPRGWDHLVASDGTTRRVVPVVLAAFLLGCRQVVGLGGWGGWCSGRSA